MSEKTSPAAEKSPPEKPKELKKHNFPGALIVAEGLDGSGKTTQLTLLQRFLENKGYAVIYTERRESRLLARAIGAAKEAKTLTPLTYSLIHLADFCDRWERLIITSLQAGKVVLVDKYIFTSFARDAARELERDWTAKNYEFACLPDVTFYLRLTPEEAVKRVLLDRQAGYYDTGMDMGLSSRERTSHVSFYKLISKEYENLSSTFAFTAVDAMQPIHQIQTSIRKTVLPLIQQKLGPEE